LPEYVDRLVKCGFNLIDAFEICDDYLYDSDYEGLVDYIRQIEVEQKRGERNVRRV